ncbi:MAG: S9 family peptidase [Acidobacteria bacterium]|nr:S9 family peptidase [Acidobacteriota bacterium]
MRHIIRYVAVNWIFLWLPAWAQAPGAWTPEISMQVRGIGRVVPSPDGRLVAYTQSHTILEPGSSKTLTHLFLARADGSYRMQLTRGEGGAGSPSFSPDGRFVLFLSNRSDRPSLWRIPVDGGEAKRLTDWKGRLDGYQISPNGNWIAFTGVEPSEEEEKARKEKRDWRVLDENPRGSSLWVIPTEPSVHGKREVRSVFAASDHITGFDWSPDSRQIAFEHQPTPGEDTWVRSDVSEVEVESGRVRAMASTGAAEGEPRYSPDGRFLVFLRTPDPARWAGEEQIVLLPRQGGASRVLPNTWDEGPSIPGMESWFSPALIPRKAMGEILHWSFDSSRLLFTGEKGTRKVLYAVSLDGLTKAVYVPPNGIVSNATLNAKGTHAGLAIESPAEPPEAFVMHLSGGAPIRLSAANVNLPKHPLGETRRIQWKAKDGLQVEGLLTLPVGYESGKRYPLVLIIHGGPMGWFNENFLGNRDIYPLASFAAKGYAILRPNIRGSGGYGKKFRFANLNDWGGKDYADLMAGVDHVISTGVADPERLAVMGWSYGGYMTSWVMTQTKRFKAAVVGAGVTNLWSCAGTMDIQGFLPDYFSGEPWDNLDAYLKHSPMYYVKGVTTPTLILHGEADRRVPISQGYELYNALRRQGVTTKMVVYPRMGHGPSEPNAALDIMRRHLDWVERYVR